MKTDKSDLHPRIFCQRPTEPCDCPPGCCEDAGVRLQRCSKCEVEAAAFVCSAPGFPVNGGAYYS